MCPLARPHKQGRSDAAPTSKDTLIFIYGNGCLVQSAGWPLVLELASTTVQLSVIDYFYGELGPAMAPETGSQRGRSTNVSLSCRWTADSSCHPLTRPVTSVSECGKLPRRTQNEESP